jgi:hypothetical protein
MKFALIALVASASATLPPCHGNNGPLGINCAVPVCNGTNGPKDGPTGTPCTAEEVASIPHYNTDPTAGRPYATTGDITRTENGIGHYPSPPNHDNYNNGHLMTPAPYTVGGWNPGHSVQPLSTYGSEPVTTQATGARAFGTAYVQTEEMMVPTPRPIGVLMAEIMENY